LIDLILDPLNVDLNIGMANDWPIVIVVGRAARVFNVGVAFKTCNNPVKIKNFLIIKIKTGIFIRIIFFIFLAD
jgi:hypothetical protein